MVGHYFFMVSVGVGFVSEVFEGCLRFLKVKSRGRKNKNLALIFEKGLGKKSKVI